jgi:hypothetical protein
VLVLSLREVQYAAENELQYERENLEKIYRSKAKWLTPTIGDNAFWLPANKQLVFRKGKTIASVTFARAAHQNELDTAQVARSWKRSSNSASRPGELTLAQLHAFERAPSPVELAAVRASASRPVPRGGAHRREGKAVYGINTGFGKLAQTHIPRPARAAADATSSSPTAWAWARSFGRGACGSRCC